MIIKKVQDMINHSIASSYCRHLTQFTILSYSLLFFNSIDTNILSLGLAQTVFECSMYTFVLLYTPALEQSIKSMSWDPLETCHLQQKLTHSLLLSIYRLQNFHGASSSGLLVLRHDVLHHARLHRLQDPFQQGHGHRQIALDRPPHFGCFLLLHCHPRQQRTFLWATLLYLLSKSIHELSRCCSNFF